MKINDDGAVRMTDDDLARLTEDDMRAACAQVDPSLRHQLEAAVERGLLKERIPPEILLAWIDAHYPGLLEQVAQAASREIGVIVLEKHFADVLDEMERRGEAVYLGDGRYRIVAGGAETPPRPDKNARTRLN